MEVSIIIPIKNEPYINSLVKQIRDLMKDFNYEIIIVDKSDITPTINGAKIIKQKTDGLGNAILEGVKHSKGNVIITMDGDGSHRPVDIARILKKIKNYDIVIGSRFVKGGRSLDKSHRKLISLIFRKLCSFILQLDVEDVLSGFAGIKKEVFQNIELNPLGYKFLMETMYKSKGKYKIYEMPIIFRSRKGGKSKANVKEAFNIIRYAIELRMGLR